MSGVSHIEVTRSESGQKLVNFLERRLGSDVPRPLLMRLIRTGQVRVDGGRKKPFDRVNEGQAVRVPPVRTSGEKKSVPGAAKLPLAHESTDLLAVDKPAGLPTHPGSGHHDSVAGRLKSMFPDDPFAPTPAHRLDKDTTGLLLAARTYEKLRELQRLFKEGRVGKFYLAWVAAELAAGRDEPMSDLLAKHGGENGELVRTGSGKPAAARFRCLRTIRGASLVEVELLTGRTHQIRVQLSSRGMPIIGDPKYGRSAKSGMLLHCWKLILPDLTLTLPPEWKGRFAVDQSLLS
jgi:23S rRNA pseudouridine955/2504/2580 synthase